MRYRIKLLLACAGLAVVSCALVFAFFYSLSKRALLDQIQSTVLAIAVSSAGELDGDLHDMIRGEGAGDSRAYKEIQGILRKIRDEHRMSGLDVAFIYTIRPGDAGQSNWIYVVDGEEDTADKSHYGDPFVFEVDDLKDSGRMLGAPPRPDSGFTHDKFGSWLSAEAPILNSRGQSVARVGIDLKASDVVSEMHSFFIKALGGLVVVGGVGVMMSLFLSRWANRPLEKITSALNEIGGGDLNTRIKIDRNDEFGKVEKAVNEMAESLQERTALRGALSRYVTRDVAQEVVDLKGEPETDVGGQRRQITALFCDLEGFEPLHESFSAEEVILLLNTFFSRTVEVVFGHGGTMDRFVGAGLMATFGAESEMADHEENAVAAALAIFDDVTRLAEELFPGRPIDLGIRIGVHTGVAIVGEMGSDKWMAFKAIGPAVTEASRIVARAREEGVSVLVSEATAGAVRDRFSFREVGSLEAGEHAGETKLFRPLGDRKVG